MRRQARRGVAAMATVAGLAVAIPGTAAARPPLCEADAIQQALIDAGKLTQEQIDLGVVVDLVRCGDMTNDGDADVLFTLASGGTAGDTRFGVFTGQADGSVDRLVLFKSGYKLGIARRDRRSFEVIQPHYRANEPNCCPSSFRVRRYVWTGSRFERKGKVRTLKTAPRRFYRR